MPISLDANPTARNPNEAPSPNSDKDLELATRMCLQMLKDKGMGVIKSAMNGSKDPAQVIGQFIGQLFGTVGERLSKLGVDMRVFLKPKGVLTAVLNYIREQTGISEEQANQIYIEVMNMIKSGALSGTQAQPQGQPPQGGEQPVIPQGPPQEAPQGQPMGGNPQ